MTVFPFFCSYSESKFKTLSAPPPAIERITKAFFDTYPDGRISEYEQFEITTNAGDIIDELYSNDIYMFEDGQYQDALDYKKDR